MSEHFDVGVSLSLDEVVIEELERAHESIRQLEQTANKGVVSAVQLSELAIPHQAGAALQDAQNVTTKTVTASPSEALDDVQQPAYEKPDGVPGESSHASGRQARLQMRSVSPQSSLTAEMPGAPVGLQPMDGKSTQNVGSFEPQTHRAVPPRSRRETSGRASGGVLPKPALQEQVIAPPRKVAALRTSQPEASLPRSVEQGNFVKSETHSSETFGAGNQTGGPASVDRHDAQRSEPPRPMPLKAASPFVRRGAPVDGPDSGNKNLQPVSGTETINPSTAASLSAADFAGASGAKQLDDGAAAERQMQISGDVYLDGAVVGRWISKQLAFEARRASAGPTGFDIRRGQLLPGPTVT